jgi:hypothetical protein
LNAEDKTPGRNGATFFRSAIARASVRFAGGLIVSYAAFVLPAMQLAPYPQGGLIAVGLATVANASYWLWRGARFVAQRREADETWVSAFKRSESGKFGIAISGVISWALIFAILNTGLQRVGL